MARRERRADAVQTADRRVDQGRGDIVTESEFADFELRLQWAVEPGANSGIFFFAREGTADRIWKTAPEVQVLDDARHKDGALPSHRAGALYDIYEPKCNALKPPGEYNDARLVVRKGHVEHWLNGYRLVEYDLDSDDFRKRVAASKFRDQPQFARVQRGRLGLQDHGDVIRFRNIRLRNPRSPSCMGFIAAALASKTDYDVIVVGSGAAAVKPPTRCAMEGAKVLMLEAGGGTTIR